jgi:myosin-5
MLNIRAGCLARKAYAAKREAAAAISIQKYVRRWLLRCAYMKLCSAAIIIQSNIRGFSIRQRFLHAKKHKAATLIQVNLKWRYRSFMWLNLPCMNWG